MAPPSHQKPPTPRYPSGDSLRDTDLFGPESEAFLSAEAPISQDVAHLLAITGPKSKPRSHSRLRDVIGYSDDYFLEENGETDGHAPPGPPASASSTSNSRKKGLRPSPWWMLIITACSSIVMRYVEY